MTKEQISQLEAALSNASSIDAIWKVIVRADTQFRHGVVATLSEAAFASQIAAKAVRLGDKGQTNITRFVDWNASLAMCIPASEEPMVRIQVQEARSSLGKFMSNLRWPLRLELTKRALNMAAAKVGTDQHKPACWLINSIGWRSPEIAKRLWDASQELPGEGGDLAFSVLIEIGVPANRRSLYLKEAHRRYSERRSQTNLFAIGHLASPESLRVLTLPSSWTSPKEEQEYVTFIPPTIAMISDHNDSSVIACLAVDRLRTLFRSNPEKMAHSIYMAGNVVPNCDSEEATRLLLDLMAEDGAREQPATHNIYLLLHRLEQCVRPRQIAGYRLRHEPNKLTELLERAVAEPNDYTGRSATYEGHIKDSLWNLSLMVSYSGTLELAFKLLKADQNPYTRFKALEDLSCFALKSIPKEIANWIIAKGGDADPEANAEAILRSTALRLAWSSESEEGFNLLLQSEYTHLGHTLQDSADGLAHLAVFLSKNGSERRRIIKKIFAKFNANPPSPTSGMVCEAIHALAFSGRLSKGDYQKLCISIVDEPSWMGPYDITRIVSAVGKGPKAFISGRLREKLMQWITAKDERLATACFETLINAGLLSELPAEALTRLGLSRTGDRWNYAPQSDDFEPNGGLFVMLLLSNYDRFAGVFASFLELSPFRSFVQAVDALERRNRTKKILFAPAFTEALLRRASSRNTLYDAEPYVFRCLATHDYKAFATQNWSSRYSVWAPESREALAIAFLKGSANPQSFPKEALATLGALQGDFNFGVRRAAFRSLGALRPELLTTIVGNLASGSTPAQRILAAEAIFWIPLEKRKKDWRRLLEHLQSDEAEDVRDAARDARLRARKLSWANEFLSHLTASFPKKEPNPAVLSRWKFASAIAHVGDDQTAQQLRHHLRSVLLPACYQRFLIRTTESLEKNWQKCRSKWPEPMFAGDVSISSGEGELIVEGEVWQVQYVVWRNSDVSNPTSLVFGGVAVLPNPTKKTDLMGKALRLNLSDGKQAEIFINRIQNQRRLEFGGQEIPEKAQQPGYSISEPLVAENKGLQS